MSEKKIIETPQEVKGKNPKVTVHPKPEEKPNVKVNPQPQKPQTEEEAFMSYMNQLISNAVLDNEAIKTKTVDVLKSLGQQLGIYMREVTRLKEELDKLKNPKKATETKKPENAPEPEK